MGKLIRYITIIIFSFIEVILIFRLIFKLVGANEISRFVSYIYEVTEPLLSPFLLAFPTPSINGQFIVEFTTLFAIFVYAFIGYLIQELLTFLHKKK